MGSVLSSQLGGNDNDLKSYEQTSVNNSEKAHEDPKVQECKEFIEKPKVETAKVKTEEEVPGFLASFFGNWSTLNKTYEPTEEEKKVDECEKIIATGGEEKGRIENQGNAQDKDIIGNETNDNGLDDINIGKNEQGSNNNTASNIVKSANLEENNSKQNIFEPTPTMPKANKVGGRRTRKNKPRRHISRKNAELQTSV